MSSDDLNRIVRDTASRGAGLGTSRDVLSTPTEQVGFQATEEYTSRISSPHPQSGGDNSSGFPFGHGNSSRTHVDSPLRKESSSMDSIQKAEFEGALSKGLHIDRASGSEAGGDDTIHVDPPSRRSSRIISGDPADDTRPQSAFGGDDDELLEEHGYSAPILAADEVAKEPLGYELQPAVSPLHERRSYDEAGYYSSTPGSRTTSRPGSIHGNVSGARPIEPQFLEEVQEYEPLFPEDEKTDSTEKPLSAVDRLKRPEYKNRKFPSQDVWEDTPNSLQYTATVSTPQLPEDDEDAPKESTETAAQAFARRQEELAEKEAADKESFLHAEKKPWSHLPHLAAETRPGMKQRFPSRDIWEDTPDSLQLQTTVTTPQTPEQDTLSPPDERPTTGAVVYHHEKAAAGLELGKDEGRATTGIAATLKPSVPARPVRSKRDESPEKAQPEVPERPAQRQKQVPAADEAGPPLPLKSKPQIPARPAKPAAQGSPENNPLTTVVSNSSAKPVGPEQSSSTVGKAKPPVPTRPVGSKIAALQGGFLSDLNARLKLGPQAPKKEEPKPEEKVEEKEKVPLSDARKGRARGPARRAPARSSMPAAASTVTPTAAALAASTPATTWFIDADEILHVKAQTGETKTEETRIEETGSTDIKAAQSSTPTLATNVAGQSLHEPSEIAPGAEMSASPPSAVEDLHAQQREESQKDAIIAGAPANETEPDKASNLPSIVDESGAEKAAVPETAAVVSNEAGEGAKAKHVE
ncbi:hypothetical protein ACMFMG_008841 [Clarireedia jacksonii]